MKKNIRYITLLCLVIWNTSCHKEQFVDATEVSIWNNTEKPVDIYVNGEKAVTVTDFNGSVYLLAGDYEIVAKSEEKELDRISVSLDRKTESNTYNKYVFDVGEKKSYVLMSMANLYEGGNGELELKEKYLNTNYINIESNTYHVYWPWSILPSSVYAYENSQPGIYQLFELPKKYENKRDIEIEKYCLSVSR